MEVEPERSLAPPSFLANDFQDVPFLEIIVSLDDDSAIQAHGDFIDLFAEVAKAGDYGIVKNSSVT